MPDDPHPATLDHGPTVDRSIPVDARADLGNCPPSRQIPRRRRTMVALGTLITVTGLGLWAYDSFTPPPAVSAAVAPPSEGRAGLVPAQGCALATPNPQL